MQLHVYSAEVFWTEKKLVQIVQVFFCVQKTCTNCTLFFVCTITICFLDKKKRLEKSVQDIYRFWILPFWAPTSVRWVATFYLIHFLEKKYKKTAIGAVEGKIQNLYSLKCKLYNFFFVCKKLVQIVQVFCTEKKLVQFGQVFFVCSYNLFFVQQNTTGKKCAGQTRSCTVYGIYPRLIHFHARYCPSIYFTWNSFQTTEAFIHWMNVKLTV